MALWLVRAGKFGEHESRFFADNRIYLTWEVLGKHDLTAVKDYPGLKQIVAELFPEYSPVQIGNAAGQFRAFALRMKQGDLVAVPLKQKSAIAFGEIMSPPMYDVTAEPAYRHYREVKWIHSGVPRSDFGQDLLYSFGSLLTISQMQRNEAEKRVRDQWANGWKAKAPHIVAPKVGDEDVDGLDEEVLDLEQLGRDAIAQQIISRFKGKKMEYLVAAILRAQGYTTFVSPEGADKGVDILAAPGPLGFGSPRLCVQVKSTDAPVDHPTLNQLIGTMQTVHADQGLLVSWGGFKSSIEKETANQYFRVRLWGQKELIDQILEHYHKLDEEIQLELPLKRIWTISPNEDVA